MNIVWNIDCLYIRKIVKIQRLADGKFFDVNTYLYNSNNEQRRSREGQQQPDDERGRAGAARGKPRGPLLPRRQRQAPGSPRGVPSVAARPRS